MYEVGDTNEVNKVHYYLIDYLYFTKITGRKNNKNSLDLKSYSKYIK